MKFNCSLDAILSNIVCNGIVVTNAAGALVTQIQSEAISGTNPSITITDVSALSKKN